MCFYILYLYTFSEISKKSKQVCLTAASADQNITADQQQRKLKADKAMTVYRIYGIGTVVGMSAVILMHSAGIKL